MSKLIAVTLFVVLLFQGAWVESAKISKVETEGQTPLLFPPDYTSKGSAFAECLTGNSTTDMAIWRGGSALRGRTSNFQFLNDSPTDVWYSCSADGVNLIEVGWYAQCPPIWVYITSQGTTWKQNTTCCIPPTVFSPPFQVCGQTYSSCKELFLDPYSANNFPAGGLFAMPATDCVDSTGGGRGIRCQPLKNGTWLSDSRYNFQYSVINQTDTLQTIPGTNYVWPTSIQATGFSSNFEFIAGNFSYFDGQLGDPTTAIDDSLQAYCDMSAANVSQISVVLPNQVLVLESENYPNKLTFYDFATQQLSPSMAFPIDQVNDNYGWLNGIAPYVSPITGTNDPCKALAFGFNYTTRTLTALLLDLPGQNLTKYPVSGFPKHVDPNFDTPVCSDSLPVCILPLYVDEATFLYNLTWSPGSSSMQLSLLKVVPFESDMMFVTDTDIWLVYEQYYSFQIVRLELATGHLRGEWAYTNLDETTFLSIKQFDPKSLTFYGIQSSYFANLFAFQYSLTNGMFTGGLALYENNVDIEMIPIDQSVIFFTCPPFYLSNGDLTVSFIGPNTSQGNMVITRNQNTNLRIFQFPENNSVEKFDYITPQFFSSCPALQP